MRSSFVAFCVFAIYVSSSTCASSFARRDGGISYPNAALANVDTHSSDNYPTGSSSDQAPPKPMGKTDPQPTDKPDSKPMDKTDSKPMGKPDSKTSWTPPPAHAKDQGTENPDYPTWGSGPTNKTDQPSVSSPSDTKPAHKDDSDDQSPPAQGVSYPDGGSTGEAKKDPQPKPDEQEQSDNPTNATGQGSSSPCPADKNLTSIPASGNSSNGTDVSPTLKCEEYAEANTTHASCDKNPAIVCTGGCTGPKIAHDCQLNATSPNTTQTCTLAYGRSSATSYVCSNEDGAYSCTGPSSGEATCTGCVDASSMNSTTSPDGTSSGSGNETSTEGPTNNGALISPMNAILTAAFTVVGSAVLL
ncbi:secreted protein [Melampsora americana]|nr:secreted protein [Melampsora americana]